MVSLAGGECNYGLGTVNLVKADLKVSILINDDDLCRGLRGLALLAGQSPC